MEGVADVRAPVMRPRFPPEWLEEQHQDVEPPGLPQHRPEWWRLAMFTTGVLAVSLLMAERIAPPPREEAPPRNRWVEGTVERLEAMPSGTSTITVAPVTGTATTATLNFEQTSVFHHRGGVGTIAHLKLGQQVRLLYERGAAKSIEVLRGPVPALLP